MTPAEYKEKLTVIQNNFEKEKRELNEKYAKENEKFESGDIITDGQKIILIDNIGWYKPLVSNYPAPLYIGKLLTKKLTPQVNNENGAIYGNNNVTKITKKANNNIKINLN